MNYRHNRKHSAKLYNTNISIHFISIQKVPYCTIIRTPYNFVFSLMHVYLAPYHYQAPQSMCYVTLPTYNHYEHRAAQLTLLSIIFNGVSSQPLVHCAHSKIGFTLSDKETYIVLNPKVRTQPGIMRCCYLATFLHLCKAFLRRLKPRLLSLKHIF